MRLKGVISCAITLLVICSGSRVKKPTILVSILARNKAHALPYFLSNFERLDYPKDRISLWIASDHNSDDTIKILKEWIESVKNDYHVISTYFSKGVSEYEDETGPAHWTEARFNNVIRLREESLDFGRKIWADYFLSLDCDVFLTNRDILNYLIEQNKTIVSPMLRSENLYSNFWHGMTDDYYYQRTDEYQPIFNRENVGCFAVPMVHSCVLINLNKVESDFLTYVPKKIPNFDGPNDDIIAFAISAKFNNVPLYLCNEYEFGYIMVPLDQTESFHMDYFQLTNIKLEMLNSGQQLYINDLFKKYVILPKKDTIGFDKIYMINLLRRPDRRNRMHLCFDELGLDVTTINAIDGQNINQSTLNQITQMPEYADPYHKRPMKLGEIGCFLSHLQIWEDIILNRYETALILEDDVRFEPYFKNKVNRIMVETKHIPDWDLIYLGRKRMQEEPEEVVPGTEHLVLAGYSYWTLGYVLRKSGAKKLLDAKPLERMVPVDEYLPILMDKHPRESWKQYYYPRNLVGLSAAPLLLYPTHYTGEEGYVSDTEDSQIIENDVNTKEDL